MPIEPRPKRLPSVTYEVPTACGHSYITISEHDGKPFEVFGMLGRSGSCAKAQMEGLTRCISMGLRHGVPIDVYASSISYLACSKPPIRDGKDKITSCADAVAHGILLYMADHGGVPDELQARLDRIKEEAIQDGQDGDSPSKTNAAE